MKEKWERKKERKKERERERTFGGDRNERKNSEIGAAREQHGWIVGIGGEEWCLCFLKPSWLHCIPGFCLDSYVNFTFILLSFDSFLTMKIIKLKFIRFSLI